MSNLPTDIAQQALDAIGCRETIGDLEEGSRPAQILLRWYDPCLQQLLRSAHWDFARKQAAMVMVADATGNTQAVSTIVIQPWIYEYLYPQDCLKARFVPATPFLPPGAVPAGNIAPADPSVPQTGGALGTIPVGLRLVPARWLAATDFNMPLQNPEPGWWDQPNVSPLGTRVICTNQPCASLVYTQYVPYPNMWDARFREGFVHYLASECVLALGTAGLLGVPQAQQLALKTSQHQLAHQRVQAARQTDGNEGVSSTDHQPDWMSVRGGYGAPWGAGGGAFAGGFAGGSLYAGWDTAWFGNDGAY